MRRAASATLSPRSSSISSSTSPGCVGARCVGRPAAVSASVRRGALVVILAAHIVGISFLEPERDPKLIVHANTEGACAVALQGFEAMATHHREVAGLRRRVQRVQAFAHHLPQLARELPGGLAVQTV